MFVRISISLSFTKSQWFSFSTKYFRETSSEQQYVNLIFVRTLDSSPRVLAGTNHFVADTNEIRGPTHSKWEMSVHGCVHVSYCLIVYWKLIDLNTIGRQFRHYFGLKCTNTLFVMLKKLKLIKITLNFINSGLEMVSALAITGMIFTLLSNFFMQTRSKDFNLQRSLWQGSVK